MLRHKKEQMFYMITNLVRVHPRVFVQFLELLKQKCSQGRGDQRGFSKFDVQETIEYIKSFEPVRPVFLNQ